MNFTLAAYPDSEADEVFDKILCQMTVEAGRLSNGPSRDLMECECGHPILCFHARDHKKPELVFGGAICLNPSCTVMNVTIGTDEDAI